MNIDTNTSAEIKKLKYFSNNIFNSCKNMKKNSTILILSWDTIDNKKLLMTVLKDLQSFGFINYSASFTSIKITLTVYGKLRVNRHTGWYD